ncbi:UNVERIFIED_CONTAM: putative disease resistance protein [Sesamum calycinum]|uniref:Disease resistance protein n=1 Tax=Sesamum calycinum TaxID=2727403 RepID=A0AAW2R6P5_9LAMI
MAGYNLQPFDGKTDFSIWQQKMKGILIQQKVFKAIDGKYADNVSDDKKLENDEYAYSSIILNLSDSVIRKVGKQSSAKMLWDKLEELYTETSLPSKLFLLEKFFRYKLDMSKNIDKNIDEFTKLIQNIKLTGDKNIDDYSPIVLLNAIPETYGDIKAAIKYGRDNVQLETVISGLKNKKEWIIDSGCTFHMTPFKDILSNYKTEKLGCASMANEKLCAVHGGDVCMIFENGFKLTLKNVRHVPDLAQNLISCSALEEEGLEGKWGKGVMKILKGSLTVFKAERKRNLYVCSVDYDFHAASVVHQNVSDLWHKSTRPDIAYAVSCLSRYMSNAGLPHWEALKWLLRTFVGGGKLKLDGLNELETLVGFDSLTDDASHLLKLPKLQRLQHQIGRRQRSLREAVDVHSLTRLMINCRVSKLPSYRPGLFQNLVSLILFDSHIEKDPMEILEKLPTLRYLRLWGYSYVGREMVCGATGFPQLRLLSLEGLRNVEEWRVEEGQCLIFVAYVSVDAIN